MTSHSSPNTTTTNMTASGTLRHRRQAQHPDGTMISCETRQDHTSDHITDTIHHSVQHADHETESKDTIDNPSTQSSPHMSHGPHELSIVIINILMDMKTRGVLAKSIGSGLIYITTKKSLLDQTWVQICKPWTERTQSTSSSTATVLMIPVQTIAKWNHCAAELCKLHVGKNNLVYHPVNGMEQHANSKTMSVTEMTHFLAMLEFDGYLCYLFQNQLADLVRRTVTTNSEECQTVHRLVEREICHYWTKWKQWKNIADVISEIHYNAAAILSKYKQS